MVEWESNAIESGTVRLLLCVIASLLVPVVPCRNTELLQLQVWIQTAAVRITNHIDKIRSLQRHFKMISEICL